MCVCADKYIREYNVFFPTSLRYRISLSLSILRIHTYSSNCQISDRVNTHPGNMFEDVWPAGFRIYCLYTSVSSLTHAYTIYCSYDAAFFSNIFHDCFVSLLFTLSQCLSLLMYISTQHTHTHTEGIWKSVSHWHGNHMMHCRPGDTSCYTKQMVH